MALEQPGITISPLLKTKITAPRIPPDFVRRSRLTDQIDRGVRGPLTLLSAPAGYGKTNLLIEWMQNTGLPVAWLNLDSEDNDLSRFFHYLIGAFQTLTPRLGEEALDFIQSTRGSGLEVGLTLLINEIASLPKELVLVLDDFQVLEETTILHSVGFFLKNLPPNMHMIIASRCEPALDLAWLRAKGRLLELNMEDLRFSGEEVALFIQQVMGLPLPPETIQALEKRTDGWITGLQLAAISLRNQPDPTTLLANLQGPAHYLVDFLAEEVLDRQPEDIRQFLLRSSILKVLNGPLCEAVVNPDAQPGYGMVMLNRLQHANLFILSLDEKHEWFRYHNLFADFLRHIQAEINPAETPVLQKRAALWFEHNGNLDEAFQYALASEDMEWTATLIERNIDSVIKTGDLNSLTRWVNKLPDDVIHRFPRLCLCYAWGLIAAYQVDNAQYWIQDVQQTLDQIEKQAGTAASAGETETAKSYEKLGLWTIRGGLALCQSTAALLTGEIEQAAEYSKQAVNDLGEDSPLVLSMLALNDSLYFILSGDPAKAIVSLRKSIQAARRANNLLAMVIATCQLAEAQALQGQLDLAWTTLQKAQYMSIGPDGKPLPIVGMADIGLGEILLERNSLVEANTYLKHGLEAAGSMSWLSNLDGLVSLARVRLAQGDISGSQAIIEEASRMALRTESSQWDDAFVSAMAVRLALLQDDLSTAEQWWKRGAFPDFLANIPLSDYPYHIYEFLVLTQARLLIAIGRRERHSRYLQHALELLEPSLLEARRLQRVTSQIEILVLKAGALHSLGDMQQAVKTFREALALGEPEGYRRIYLDGGQPAAELLARTQSEAAADDDILPTREFISSLLASFQARPATGETALPPVPISHEPVVAKAQDEDGLLVTLSARELEVLNLIAQGKSNQEISAQLYLALNTVKRHAYNIYTKLNVNKRTQAVSKARQLGLIP